MDGVIASAFLALAPRFLVFEQTHLSTEALATLLEELRAAGYTADCAAKPCPNRNVVAVRSA